VGGRKICEKIGEEYRRKWYKKREEGIANMSSRLTGSLHIQENLQGMINKHEHNEGKGFMGWWMIEGKKRVGRFANRCG